MNTSISKLLLLLLAIYSIKTQSAETSYITRSTYPEGIVTLEQLNDYLIFLEQNNPKTFVISDRSSAWGFYYGFGSLKYTLEKAMTFCHKGLTSPHSERCQAIITNDISHVPMHP